MTSRTVTLMLRSKTENGWRRFPAAFGANGKIRPGYASVGDQQLALPGGHYQLRYYVGRKVVYRNVGKDAYAANAARIREEKLMAARESAQAAGTKIIESPDDSRKRLSKEKKRWLDRLEARAKLRAVQTHTISINDFLMVTEHTFADQITEDSMLAFYTALRKRGNSPRTIYNKAMDLSGWFKWMGLEVKKIIPDKPDYTEKEVEVYSPEELGQFFESVQKPDGCFTAKGARYQYVLFQTLLKTGLRELEAVHLLWLNVDSRGKVLRVRENWETGSTIKDRAERSVPLPDDLLALLKEWKAERPGTKLVFGTSSDNPNTSMLYQLKASARRAGLNCGHCEGCASKNRECYRWYLHKFRATYITTLLQNGVDPRTIMEYTGHEDLETIMRYMAPAKMHTQQPKISAIQWTA